MQAELRIESSLRLREATLTLRTTDSVELRSPRVIRTAPDVDRPALSTVSFVVTRAGTGQIVAELTGVAPGGTPLRFQVALDYATGAGRVVLSGNGLLEAQVGALSLERRELGSKYGQRLVSLLGGGARQQFHSAPRGPLTPSTTTVSGTIDYVASNGKKHPCRSIEVKIVDLDKTVLATTTTSLTGHYTSTINTMRPDGVYADVSVRALAENGNFSINAVDSATPQYIASAFHDVSGSPLTVNLTANNTSDNDTAFDIADMLVTGDEYVLRIHHNVPFPLIRVSYPDAEGTAFSPKDNTAKILVANRFDWDAVLHEFGHYVAANLGIDDSSGGMHGFLDNLGEQYGKKKGIALAWSEGFATWFSLTAQLAEGVAAMHIPNAGDSFYDDPSAGLHVPLATNLPSPSLGEDNELSVARFLWHVHLDADINMSDIQIINALVAAKATTLSAAVAALLPADGASSFDDSSPISSTGGFKSNLFACVLSAQTVSPRIISPKTGATLPGTPQTYSWVPNGAGHLFRLTQFNVQFWSQNWGTLLYESPTISNAYDYTPTQAAWTTVTQALDTSGGSSLNVVVKGLGTDAPETGPYKSCAITQSTGATITATPYDTTYNGIASYPINCPNGYFPTDIDLLYLNGSNLQPSTTYSLEFYDPNNGYGPVPLGGPVSVTTNANGELVNAVVGIAPMPAESKWPLIATPPSGPSVTTTVPIGWTACAVFSSQTSPTFVVRYAGAGVAPSSTVSFYWNGVFQASTTSSANGEFDGFTPTITCTGASNTLTISATTFNGASSIVQDGVPCDV